MPNTQFEEVVQNDEDPIDEWTCANGDACVQDGGARIGLVLDDDDDSPTRGCRWVLCWHPPGEPDKRYCEDCTIEIEETS